jgi:hypothetical protein
MGTVWFRLELKPYQGSSRNWVRFPASPPIRALLHTVLASMRFAATKCGPVVQVIVALEVVGSPHKYSINLYELRRGVAKR